ncbi:amidohydrolase [Mycolicibacterium sp. 018/SC-01/001]|uniref:amidohydrolase family protein n=1 Tax=Mycolicibacterium sp. 018/SC-01/001 TaxID=2592069 RepID=UPI00117EA403|nr:amidohydrolase family protein [Mycolicibacterium sp. 018/SC-01/001]TRW88457.1 amidohydrolase [Mycolicibacterium sp. 018/SC-01/001]
MSTTLRSRTGADLIDVHAHYAVPIPGDELPGILAAYRKSHFLSPPASSWSPELAVDFMNRFGIRAQMLSNPNQLSVAAAQRFNDVGAEIVAAQPDRFGLLANLPLVEPRLTLNEIDRAADDLHADGFVLITNYDGRYLGDPAFDDVMAALDERAATVFVHPVEPAGFGHLSCGRPGPVIEFPMDTARTIVDAMYARVFLRYPQINFVIAHAGGVLPALAARIATIGMLPWVPNPSGVTVDDIRRQLASLYYDTALSAYPHSLLPLLETTTASHIVYGSDYPPAGESVIETNMQQLKSTTILDDDELGAMASTATALFPRLGRSAS